MARIGLQAMMATKLVLPDPAVVPICQPRPGQSPSADVEFFSVREERQMQEWEGYQRLRNNLVEAALGVLKEQDPDAPYVAVRRSYTLYVDPFRKPPPPLAHVDPAHQCGVCGSFASHLVLLWCNHLFCFVCARRQLNKSWLCPKEGCDILQRHPPLRQTELEKEIKQVYTAFADVSQVNYGWGDVRFPRAASSL
ncbi:hypothetical protein C8F01DRAFT_1100531 [Mycena amicta]|nr:hypothetical protein C8F01DRAFT_1100531 [Mycena amicta]